MFHVLIHKNILRTTRGSRQAEGLELSPEHRQTAIAVLRELSLPDLSEADPLSALGDSMDLLYAITILEPRLNVTIPPSKLAGAHSVKDLLDAMEAN